MKRYHMVCWMCIMLLLCGCHTSVGQLHSSDVIQNTPETERSDGMVDDYDETLNEHRYYGPLILNEETARAVAESLLSSYDPTVLNEFPVVETTYDETVQGYTVSLFDADDAIGAHVELNTFPMTHDQLKIEHFQVKGRDVSLEEFMNEAQAQAVGDVIMASVYAAYGKEDQSIEVLYPERSVLRNEELDYGTDGWIVLRQNPNGYDMGLYVYDDGTVDGMFWNDIRG